MAEFVRRRDERALDLYLLFRAVAARAPWDVTEAAAVWARALGLTSSPSALSAVSKAWRRLEDLKLVDRGRKGRRASIVCLRDDGSGRPYEHPRGRGDVYFKLPFAYWRADERWYRVMPLHAKALLLIARSLPDEFILPYDRAPQWYGISSDTAFRGLRWLRDRQLLYVRKTFKEAPLAPEGYTEERRYTLLSPFGPRGYRRSGNEQAS